MNYRALNQFPDMFPGHFRDSLCKIGAVVLHLLVECKLRKSHNLITCHLYH